MQRAQSPIRKQQRATQTPGTIVLSRIALSLIVESDISISTSAKVGGMLLLTKLHVPSIRGVGVGKNSGAMTFTNLGVYSFDE